MERHLLDALTLAEALEMRRSCATTAATVTGRQGL